MSENELNANQQKAVPTRSKPWNNKWNSNRVELRLNREDYTQLVQFKLKNGYEKDSEALRAILTDYLKNYPTSN